MGNRPIERYLALYLPWLFAILFKWDPLISYFIAWLGSFLIFYLTLSGWVKPIPADRPLGEQLMRPLFLMQIIFAGFMCCTTIFYLLNTLGYNNFLKIDNYYWIIDNDRLKLTAQCQRYYCLGHAAFVTGILVSMNYSKERRFYAQKNNLADLLLKVAIACVPVSVLFTKISGLAQFSYQFSSLSFIAGTLALAYAIPAKKIFNTLISLGLYALNFYQALTSGFKEPIIISIMVLGIFLYPNYKKLVVSIFVPLLLLSFFILPTYVGNFRQQAWSDDASADAASKTAIESTLNEEVSDDTNWNFLVYRLSEVDMFETFVESTPANIDFYGFTLLKQSFIALVPRVFWPGKPITEDMVMERVYDAGVVYRASAVSAKPAFIVDGYLSGGVKGIFISLFLYGAIAQLISNQAEHLFGGYILGSALMFSGLFQILWRGLSFEFLINTVFWAYITMLLLHWVFVRLKILYRV
ncbi:exosortase Y-associated Wzy-like protein [Mucilaginibacter litoreus]|uniref:Exosortase Y-associated Wzy-like protein n=1 Tax=Mucilaginibacter litoreus TaxID=1048221 RepID=A0ABW3AVG7_9SPHI